MNPYVEVIMPRMGVNDENVTIVEWLCLSGDRVARGQVLANVETTKAAFELESEDAGYIYPLAEAGASVSIRDVVALILPEPDPGVLERYLRERATPAAAKGGAGERRFTEKARALVEEHNIDMALLPVGRIIRERDVQALLAPKNMPDAGTLPKTVVIYGASQGGLAVAECIRSTGEYELLAFLDDDPARVGKHHHDIPVWPGSDLDRAREKGIGGVATHIADARVRYQLRDRAIAAGILPLNVIHAGALVAPSARLGLGNLIKAGAIVDAYVKIGDCCIIDNGVILPHHNRIGNGCHIAPGACFGGDCEVGENTVIGIGAIVSARTRIGSNVIVGVGAVVARDVPDNAIVEGTPARIVGERKQK